MLSVFSTQLFAADNQEYDPNTARAYAAYLLTFVWPDNHSSEQIDYNNVLSTESLPRYSKLQRQDNSPSAANIVQLSVPFDDFKDKINPHAPVLINKQWTLIFKHTGDAINETFHSSALGDSDPELTGNISIKLGHYLESDIHYKHYLFNLFSSPHNINVLENATAKTDQTQSTLKIFEPALVLNLEQRNKTASQKLNYIDHPIIGTLIYFEPIDLNDAIQQVALDKMWTKYVNTFLEE